MAKVPERVAKRYARALFESVSQGELDTVLAQMVSIEEQWNSSPELRAAVVNPSFPEREREEALLKVMQVLKVSDNRVLNLLKVMLAQGRLAAITSVREQFEGMIRALRKALSLEITSAFNLPLQEREVFEGACRAAVGPLASFSWKHNEELLGGLLIQSGDTVLDRSVREALNKMKEALTEW